MDFKQLKKQSSLGSLTEKLLKEAEKMGGSSSSVKDERIFSVSRDKSGLGLAIVRFLPAPEGEDSAFVKLYNHGFQVKATVGLLPTVPLLSVSNVQSVPKIQNCGTQVLIQIRKS
jgi:hypothetical protein